jgi:hypothetical protein
MRMDDKVFIGFMSLLGIAIIVGCCYAFKRKMFRSKEECLLDKQMRNLI